MTVLLSSPDDLTLDAVRRIARGGEDAELAPAALDAIGRRRDEFLAFVDANLDRYLYGITTRHDTAAKQLLDEPGRREYGAVMPPTPPTVGPPLPDRVLRTVLVARLADVLHGTAPVRPGTAGRLVDLLRRPDLPTVPAAGHGEPGDIIALGALLRPEFEHTLEIGEGMFLVNGSSVAAAVLADAVLDAGDRLDRAERVLALSAVAGSSPDMHYDEALGRIWRDPHQAEVLARFRELLSGAARPQLPYQAPVSFRSAPRVLGSVRRALAHAEQAAAIGLSAASNNPVFTGTDILSNGGYHNPLASPALDALTHGWADLTHLVTAQINRLVEVPDGVRAHESEPRVSGFGMPANGWADQARAAAQPSLVGVGRSGPTDTSTPDVLAWRQCGDAGYALDANLSLLAVLASHTLAYRKDVVPPGLADLHASVLGHYGLDTTPLGAMDAMADVFAVLTGR
ncbi:aromatic amino acid lyase [Pseudonocardia endophytica]|uniref:Histidine ammonia-lyase n=1 Tax=Pseudonocardia endophytica TaxID=401976 RepID=A0A4R1HUT3_PSEEN|nr:aromatic amino acid lyase [Pseudonocardia endophytica]TCK25171.1 histidine ammonia-lyase [Pseudonocardia endophytica]